MVTYTALFCTALFWPLLYLFSDLRVFKKLESTRINGKVLSLVKIVSTTEAEFL